MPKAEELPLSYLKERSKQAEEVSKYFYKYVGSNLNSESILNQFSLNTDAFWFRPDSLHTLIEQGISTDVFPSGFFSSRNPESIICPFVAQHELYYSSILMSTEYVKLDISNKTAYMSTLNTVLSNAVLFNGLRLPNIVEPLITLLEEEKEKPLYLFGAGNVAKDTFNVLSERNATIQGFIVSDGYREKNQYLNLPVYELSEMIDQKDNIYVVISVGKKLSKEVNAILESKGFNNIVKEGLV